MVLVHRSYGDRAAMAEAAASSAPQERRCHGEESVDGGSRPLARPCGRGSGNSTCLRAHSVFDETNGQQLLQNDKSAGHVSTRSLREGIWI